jgi:hypothetical protein
MTVFIDTYITKDYNKESFTGWITQLPIVINRFKIVHSVHY